MYISDFFFTINDNAKYIIMQIINPLKFFRKIYIRRLLLIGEYLVFE